MERSVTPGLTEGVGVRGATGVMGIRDVRSASGIKGVIGVRGAPGIMGIKDVRGATKVLMVFAILLVSALRPPQSLCAQAEAPRGDLCIMWYNAENLFHPSDDTLAGDDEFTPEGVRHWSWSRYRQKLANVARVIVAAGRWQPPELVGLGEVECAQVLEELVSHPILAPYNYSYYHRESPDHRGIDVACLFRAERFEPDGWEAISPVEAEPFGQTREMLHVWGRWGRRDTLDLFMVHFISKYRGSGATANYRAAQSALLLRLADSVQHKRPGSLLVMAGDFNDPWEGYAMEPFRQGTVGGEAVFPVLMGGQSLKDRQSMPGKQSLTGEQPLTGEQWPSYKYKGIWSGIDQFLVGGPHGRYRIAGSVLKLPGLLTPDEVYGGEKPFRTYTGYRYAGGYSDHLPILLDISRASLLDRPSLKDRSSLKDHSSLLDRPSLKDRPSL